MKILLLLFCSFVSTILFSQENLLKYVNPFIGTEKMGHTYPGATAPFGAVQLSPDTDTISYALEGKYNSDVYKYCAGYRYEDKTIVGFSHTHFSGTGHSDLGDFLVMPTVGKLNLNPGTAEHPESGFRSRFSHEEEFSEPGYYKVNLKDYNIEAELTASTRVGVHQYTFPETEDAHVILDLMSGIYNYDGKTIWTYVRVVNDSTITGYRQTYGWARTRTVYFAMHFSKSFKSYGRMDFDEQQVYRGFWRKFNQNENFPEIAGRKIRMHFDFDMNQDEKLMIKFAISPVSQSNALLNLETETPGWNFNEIKSRTQNDWNQELNKIQIKASESDKINFYTAMYHSFLSPTVYMDVNGQYKGLDQEIHQANGFTNYTTFSIWDTYRALHPLFNLIQPARNQDMVKSMMHHYEQNSLKMLPIWSHYANDNWCMSGYHSVSVVADAILKGSYLGDPNLALDACIETANKRFYEGIGDYIALGYIPDENNRTSVSNTLEYAYDDWVIAQLAKKLNRQTDYEVFLKRSHNWKNNFDPSIGLMRPKGKDGSFRANFDAMETHDMGFIEGNSWNYSFFVPHDPNGLVGSMGGKRKFTDKLNTLFTMHLPDEFFAHTEDISREGILGGYVHGNEPAHHVAYLYNWSSEPWKTQETVRHIMEMQYKPTPDGLGGNDDCGQMSAWYIFSALGFYPVAPGNDDYSLGSPLVDEAIVNLENGNKISIKALNNSKENVYVQKVLWNGKEIKDYVLKHSEILKGGELVFQMGVKPKKK